MALDEDLTRLEEAMWRPDTRCDRDWMDRHLALDFVEFGQSGRRYDRGEIINLELHVFEAVLPLRDLRFVELSSDVVLVTYRSEMNGFHANRSSIWRRTDASSWQMVFHQGTPTTPD